MTFEIRAGRTADDLRDAVSPLWHYFGLPPTDEALANFTALMSPERVFGAYVGSTAVGGCGSYPMVLSVPGGGTLPTAGLTMVGVLPTHRRQGILSALMTRFIASCRDRGEAAAYLWATEETIYGRFGFGMSGLSADIHLPRSHASLTVSDSRRHTIRHASIDECLAAARTIFNAVTRTTPGSFERSEDWWRRRTLADPAWRRNGGGELQRVLIEDDGSPAGYILYRRHMKSERGIQQGGVEVLEALGRTPDASRAAWQFLVDMDWSAWVKADFLPIDSPLLLLATEPRYLNLRVRDGAWLRLIDVGRALGARGYGPGAEVVIELTDDLCPENAGRWLVRSGAVSRTLRTPDLRCGPAALASVYLGGFSWRQLVAAGRAAAQDEEAIVRADRVFERGNAPWCPEIF